MKEIWKKTSLFYKIIAVLLTVVMVGTTMYFHFEKKYVAKAEGAIQVLKAYLPDKTVASENQNTIGGEKGWRIIESGSVGNDTNREFAYIYKVPVGTTYNANPYRQYTPSGSNVEFAGLPNFVYDGFIYYIDEVAYGFDLISNPIMISYQITGDEVVNDSTSFTPFSWVTDTSLNMTANIGEDVFNGGNFNPLASDASLSVNITSGSELTSFTFLGEDKLTNIKNENPNAKNEQTGLYNYTYSFAFSTLNNVIKNYSTNEERSIGASDGNTTKTYTASSLVYDGTDPTISLTMVGDEAYNPTKEWYSNDAATITIAITSGSDDTSESDLSTVTVNGVAETTVSGNSLTITTAVVEGVNTFVVVATDAVGNSNTETFTVRLDKTTPKVKSLKVDGDDTDGQYIGLTDGNIIISGETSDYFADNVTSGSGVSTVNIQIIKTSDNSIFAQKNFNVQTNGSYSVNFTDFDEVDPTALANGTYDGSYKVVVKATDNVNKTSTDADSKELTFTLDSTKPSITTTLERHVTGAADDEWELVPAADVDTASNTYFVNGVTYDKLRYSIAVDELNIADTEPVTIKKTDDTSTTVGTLTYDSGAFRYTISSSELSTAEALSLKAIVKDKSNNENVSDNQLLLPKLQLVDAEIKVELLEVWCDGEKIADVASLADLKTDFNSQYTIKVVAKSGFAITDLELRKGDITPAYASIPAADIGDSVDSTGIHTTNSNEFTLPSGTENEAFGSLKIYVKNSNNDTKEVPIGDLLYDHTDPSVTVIDKETGSSVDYTKWYQDITVGYEIKSGNSAVESKLKSAKYSVDGQENTLTPTEITETGDIQVSESTSTTGTNLTFEAQDNATNTLSGTKVFNIKVDKTAPTVATIKVDGKEATAATVLAGKPQLTSSITDNLTIKDYMVTVKYNDESDVYAEKAVNVNKDATEESINYTIEQLLGSKELKDGKYTVSISAKDKSDRGSNVSSTSFIVDNTAPVVTANILSGTTGKNNGYYNSDVVVRLTCKDNNFNPAAMSVTDNGSAISADWKTGNDMYYADVTLSAEGLHNIRISGNDKAGTAAQAKQVTFTIDKTVPTVSLLVNGGQIYNESRGTLNLTGPLTFTASVSDTNEDAGDLRVQVIKTVPDTATTTSEFLPTGERTFTFADEADYVINIFAIDKANNQGPTRTISFRVDTTAPQLTITGAGGTAASATSVSFNITEAFWADAKGTVEIYRKAGDGVDETLYKTLTLTPTQRAYSLSELLRESGVYRFEFTADDKVGHTATASQSITVDLNKPEITLTGVNNYDSTDGSVSISAVIKDEFYASKKVSIQGTRTDASGKKTAVSFSPFATTANPTTINDTFTEEGIYDITLTATDIAGNVTSNSVHFTIDTSDPVIGDLSMYDGKTFNAKSFEDIGLDIDLDEIVSDLTVCQVRMYLNGSEYDGISEIEDGSYTLLITAEDELGHTSEKSATFVLDTKEPIFIVTGVEDGEVRNDSYSIEVSLQLDEDTLEEVKLNDKVITVKNNVASLSVSDKGEYKLYMKATDEAGNEAEQTITFTFGDEQKSVTTAVSDAVEKAASHWWMWAIVVAAILAVGGLIFFILKRRKED